MFSRLEQGCIRAKAHLLIETISSQYIAVPDDTAGVRYNTATEREDTTHASSLVKCASTVFPAHHMNVCTRRAVKSVLILETRLLCIKVTIRTWTVVRKDSLSKSKNPSNSSTAGVLVKLSLQTKQTHTENQEKVKRSHQQLSCPLALLPTSHLFLDKHTNVSGTHS